MPDARKHKQRKVWLRKSPQPMGSKKHRATRVKAKTPPLPTYLHTLSSGRQYQGGEHDQPPSTVTENNGQQSH